MHNQPIRETSSRGANGGYMQSVFDDLYRKAKGGSSFKKLMNIIRSEQNILLAYDNVKQKTGSRTSGVDGLTIRNISKLPPENIVAAVQQKQKWYEPAPVKRIDIPKPDGETRPIGIPTIYDRIAQQSILQVLEPICEAKFYEHSYGYRPDRCAEHAIARIMALMQRSHLHHVVTVRIEDFYGSVDHTKLIQQMWTIGIRDKTLQSIVRAALRTKVILPNGEIETPSKGIVQCGILSPLFTNIVLNELDWWVSSQWESMPAAKVESKLRVFQNGHSCIDRSHAYEAFRKSNLKEMHIVRYADEFRIFCSKHEEAEKVKHAVTQWLHNRLRLEINNTVGGAINSRKKYFDFLGFKLKVHLKRSRWTVESHMSDAAISSVKAELKTQIKRMQKPSNGKSLFHLLNQYNAMVIRAHQYYQIATCIAQDCSAIAFVVNKGMKNRLPISKEGRINTAGYIGKRYGASKQMRFLMDLPVAPISYCRTRNAMHKSGLVARYTPEGRAAKRTKPSVDISKLLALMELEPRGNRSVEYYENRISLFSSQRGKCAITGVDLEIGDVHCHHIIPSSKGGKDARSNLCILHQDVHRLVHADTPAAAAKYIYLLTDDSMYHKLNALRLKCGNAPVERTEYLHND